jgi:hypothetical protein
METQPGTAGNQEVNLSALSGVGGISIKFEIGNINSRASVYNVRS